MNIEFDLSQVNYIEFGIGREDTSEHVFFMVPVNEDVQNALIEMVRDTWKALKKSDDGPTRYEPSDKHSSIDYLYLPLVDDMAKAMRDLHGAVNLPIDSEALISLDSVFCYFVRMKDNQGRNITAVRRASYFKGIVKSKGRLMRFFNDSLEIIEDNIFKLDNDFDFIIDAQNIHILRPNGFEFSGKLQQAILDAVPFNLASLKNDLPFIDFQGIEQYAIQRPRAARYIASIRGEREIKNISSEALQKLCMSTGVDVTESNGEIVIADGHEMAFLQVLDRRRYQVELVIDKPEMFVAGSRKIIK